MAEQYGLEVADFEHEFIAGGERFPGSPGDDVLVIFEDPVGQPVVTQKLPHVLDGI
ncbi:MULTISPECIES: hypothetical protein [Rhizobium]|uniref:hypothetical protein n=1 Tax=Rhizobium TaxID=379 RepID=UPI002180A090|nr:MULTISPECIES: hypothetical protein [Rhizobium]